MTEISEDAVDKAAMAMFEYEKGSSAFLFWGMSEATKDYYRGRARVCIRTYVENEKTILGSD